MLRRNAMIALAGAVPLAVAARPRAAAASAYYPTYTVLTIGSVAKQTSQILLNRSKNAATRTFAQLEIIEQTAAAQALTSNLNPPPPTLTAAQQANINKIKTVAAANLDYTYVGLQITGHQTLLAIQESILAADASRPDYDIVHVALLLRSNIQQHLILLKDILANL